MTSTRTFTHTRTFTRIALLKEQIRRILRRTTNISTNTLSLLEKGMDKKWVKKFSVYAFTKNNLCRAELVFEIDWDEYTFQLSQGKTSITIDEKWEDNTAIEVDEIIILFNDFVKTNSLTTQWMVTYTREIGRDESKLTMARKEMGLKAADAVKWASRKYGTTHHIPELPEAMVGCFLADD